MINYDFPVGTEELLKQDVEAVCNDVLSILQAKISRSPALGKKPFLVRKATDGLPRADISGLPNTYFINITCNDTRNYRKIVYQLAHELGHYYVDPTRNNWFIESTVTAISLIALEQISNKWLVSPPYAHWKFYAGEFTAYRREILCNQLVKIGLTVTEASVDTWLTATAPRSLERFKSQNREQQHACAYVIEGILNRSPLWGAIPRLGGATDQQGVTDFLAWENACDEREKPLVRELGKRFGDLMLPPPNIDNPA